ncbi:MAG TPA: hypothetical protein VJU59_10560 [Paraburkholderia sp.]|uniref:hypothetical protein n=1 Tax=Paraburkholderia sp. TaxID=1926495 RepID=UPI002B4942E8|nr:hypothetical protein [Paraburkholderia sp.]HKR40098.1 hypothetical protein [Paraburkholderia sp.]
MKRDEERCDACIRVLNRLYDGLLLDLHADGRFSRIRPFTDALAARLEPTGPELFTDLDQPGYYDAG